MTSRERVLAALRCEEPDRVPYCELGIDRALARQLMGWGDKGTEAANLESNPYRPSELIAIADRLGLDNLYAVLRAPVYAEKHPGQDGRLFYGDGLLRGREDLGLIQLPDPEQDGLYAEAAALTAAKGDRAAWFVTRAGIFPTMLGIGAERFGVALYEDREFVAEVLDRYTDWAVAVARRVMGLGFDVFVTTDDVAFNTAPFFSPKIYRELVLPRYRRLAREVTLPWVVHSDGNVLPFLDDLVELGIAGLHPLEKGAMDIDAVKRRYGRRLCLLGNVDLNLLGMATPAQVEAEVEGLIRRIGPGGGYVVTSGNSLAGYLRPENVLAMAAAVRRYGRYPLT
ncbi:MAG: uroporphyrinogen decarboxylase family protein [Candidatus Latescibacterota bacterium]|jgi:uroporphyrinogen decarboxylase